MTQLWKADVAVFKIWFEDSLAYSASGVIWVLTDFVMAISMPFIWIAAAKTNGGVVAGFPISQMVLYYLGSIVFTTFITSHMMWEIGTEIKDGNFSVALTRPYPYYRYTFMRGLAWRVFRPIIFLPFLLLLIVIFWGYLREAHACVTPQLFGSIVLGHLVSFTMVMAMAPIALFTQEAQSIFELYYAPMMFLSGQLFPISALPVWAQNLSAWMPFYYTTGAPSDMFSGKLTGSAMNSVLLIQFVWVVVFFVIGKIAWKLGLKEYTGTGL